ncbi:MAG TPA: NAD(P)-dependent oxidoreductase [Candidatus Dormibacteraeota bacterium]|nr:NAD(P)-dependent oxidoreductase [Candidatus Dormibacteraeota bacterium]
MSRVLVTGGGGFIGSHMVRILLDRGHEVALAVRPATSLSRLGDAVDRVRIVRCDLAEASDLISQLPWTPDACAHLAWHSEPSTYLVSHENLESLTVSLKLLPALMRAGCSHFVLPGTCAEYRSVEHLLTEDSDVAPTTLYAATKLSLFLITQRLAEQANATVAWARLFHVYGPQEDPRRLVPAAACSLLAGRDFPASSGLQVRDYLHVVDVARALCQLLEVGASDAVNVCSGVPATVRQLLEAIGQRVGRPALVRFGELDLRPGWDPPHVVGDNTRLRTLTGWKPQYELETGLEQVIGWWRANA